MDSNMLPLTPEIKEEIAAMIEAFNQTLSKKWPISPGMVVVICI